MLDNFLNSKFNRFPLLGISLAEVEDVCVIGEVVEDLADRKVVQVRNSLLYIHDNPDFKIISETGSCCNISFVIVLFIVLPNFTQN